MFKPAVDEVYSLIALKNRRLIKTEMMLEDSQAAVKVGIYYMALI